MYQLTQGTIISGVRSSKYSGLVCNGIVISARCDLANCKVPNIYFLIAIPCDEWIVSDEGFRTVLSGRINDLESKIETRLQNEMLDWESMKSFTHEEFEKVVSVQCESMKAKERQELIKCFKAYTLYTTSGLSQIKKREILLGEKNAVAKCILSIANGQITHYAYIPQKAFSNNECVDDGLIVDLQELDRVDEKAIELLCCYAMDSQSEMLSETQIQFYNRKFCLCDGPGYAMPNGDIKSPWVEYLMQRFSNSFTRIGVDGPQKVNVNYMIQRVCEGGLK